MKAGRRLPAGRRATSHDVASRAGVSRSAVSRTFTPGASVSPATRARVLAAAESLGYQPNLMARSLMTQRTHMVGLVMGQLRNPFFTDMLGQFEARCREQGFQTLLVTPGEDGSPDAAIEQALRYQIDGVVTVGAMPSKASVARCARARVPVVVIDRDAAPPPAGLVWIDSLALGREVAAVFRIEGRRRAAVIEGRAGEPPSTKARSFIAQWEAAGAGRVTLEHGDYTHAGGMAAALRLLAARNRPDAIFCVTDLMALGALDAARHELGVAVPAELSVIGFGDLPATGWPAYRLSTFRAPIDALVGTAVDELVTRIGRPRQTATRTLLACSFVRRHTTLPAAAGPRAADGRTAATGAARQGG
jgi:DNA-binding LacI/PurR family transcriptional regulator